MMIYDNGNDNCYYYNEIGDEVDGDDAFLYIYSKIDP